jgi:hypothetical protein
MSLERRSSSASILKKKGQSLGAEGRHNDDYSPDGAEDLLDIVGGGVGVTAGGEEQVTVTSNPLSQNIS